MIGKENINETLADAVMDRPREFFVGTQRFCLWSPTLGVSMMVSALIEKLDIDIRKMKDDVFLEALRLTVEKRVEVCHVIALTTFRKYEEICDSQLVRERCRYFSENLSESEITQLLILILTAPSIESLIEDVGLLKEQQRQVEISKYKNRDGHSQSFGGHTIYGSLISPACEKYGWTKEYVVWGIDLISLRMMLADSVSTLYLSDDEMKALGVHSTSDKVVGMTQEEIDRIKGQYDWN